MGGGRANVLTWWRTSSLITLLVLNFFEIKSFTNPALCEVDLQSPRYTGVEAIWGPQP